MDRRKSKLKSRSGLTMVELLIALIIAAVLLLAVGVLSRISIATQRKYTNEMQVHADISYGFKLLRRRVREYGYGTDTPANPWLSTRILVGSGAFGIYQDAVTSNKEFVYLPNASDVTSREVILSVPSNENFNLTLSDLIPPRSITVQIDGEKNGVTFDMSTTVTKRGP